MGDFSSERANISSSLPGRHRFRSRGCELTRYFHAYACEDMMEYAVEVHQWKLSRQASYQSGDWRQVQTEVTPAMRCSLLAWLGDVTRTLDLSLESWCLAVNYTDRFLASQLLAPDCLQLVGLTALWVAAKQEELLGLPPTTDQLVALCAETYTNINFIHMELILLAKLQFRLSAPTAAFFLAHLVAVEEGEKHWQEDLARHMVELVLEDYRLARLPPCKIANAVYVAIKGCDENAAAILESNCPRCEPDTADMWSEELFQMLLQKVLQNLAS